MLVNIGMYFLLVILCLIKKTQKAIFVVFYWDNFSDKSHSLIHFMSIYYMLSPFLKIRHAVRRGNKRYL